MSNTIAARIRRSRESRVTVGEYKYTIRRPTDYQMAELHRDKVSVIDVCKRFVIGWDKMTEADLYPGGGDKDVPFHAEIWDEYCEDHPELWEPLREAIIGAYNTHAAEVDAEVKN